MKQFYLTRDGQNYGPMTVEQLMQYGVDANSLVWAEGMAEWTPAGQVAEFMPFFAPQQPVAPAQPQYQQPVQPQYQQPEQTQYQQPEQTQYQQPAQPQYQQPAQPQYQQPMQPQYQQPMQPQYQQPMQPQYQQPMADYNQPMVDYNQPVQAGKKESISQLIFRICLFFPLVSCMLFGIIFFFILFIGGVIAGSYASSIDFIPGARGLAAYIFVAFWCLMLFIICLMAFIKTIKAKGFAFLSMGIFIVIVLFLLMLGIVVGFRDFPWLWFVLFISFSAVAFFAAVPFDDMSGGVKKIFAEASVSDYVFLGIFFLFSVIIVILCA